VIRCFLFSEFLNLFQQNCRKDILVSEYLGYRSLALETMLHAVAESGTIGLVVLTQVQIRRSVVAFFSTSLRSSMLHSTHSAKVYYSRWASLVVARDAGRFVITGAASRHLTTTRAVGATQLKASMHTLLQCYQWRHFSKSWRRFQ